MRTVIYARYSSALQDARSIEAQVAVCRERADREGWTVVDVYRDYATSGAAGIAEDQRPGLHAMLARVEAGGVEQVLADATSRLARDQGDAYVIRRRCEFAGARVFTLADGEIDDIKGLVKGFLDSQQRRDLAHNVRRSQRAVVREGRAPAGIAYGYRRANRLDERGELVRGLREIDEDQADVVRRIFADYLADVSPQKIAEALNREGVPGPRGQGWRETTIRGDTKRANGILRNRLYAGEMVVGRTSKATNPTTRRTVIRPNAADTWTIAPAEHLRIVDAATFTAVQARLADSIGRPIQAQRRKRYLLSGLGTCGVCGGGWIRAFREEWACGRWRDGGGCTNTRSIGHKSYEARVLAILQDQLLDPEFVARYVKVYHEERARRAAELGKGRDDATRKLGAVQRRIDRYVAAIGEDGAFEEIRDALFRARAERAELRARIDAADTLPVVALHPGIADDYRRQIAALGDALDGHEQAQADAVPKLRALISRVVISPASGLRGVEIDVECNINRLLGFSENGQRKTTVRSCFRKGQY